MGVVARVRDPCVVLVCRINIDRADVPVRIVRRERVKPRVGHVVLIHRVRVVGDEEATRIRRRPHRAGVAGPPLDLGNDAPGP